MKTLTDIVRYHNQKVIGWRDVPVDIRVVGPVARASMPVMKQLFIGAHVRPERVRAHALHDPQARGQTARRRATATTSTSRRCSSQTVVYKGLMLAEQVGGFYPDLQRRATS